jgi:glycosyltransferase involved in cell wall biosynthesis
MGQRRRIHVWHGYLLGGTGSNIYAREMARAWARAGHDVTVFSQDPAPERIDLGGAATVRPDTGPLLPVFVLDRYAGREVRRLQDCTRAELDAWVEANAAAVRERGPADLLLVNHVLLGGAVGAAAGQPYVVKAHGSELEYAMRGNAELANWGAEVLRGAHATIAGSRHIVRVIDDVCGPTERVGVIPPGVDVDRWRPRPRAAALEGLIAEARRDPPNPGNADDRLPDAGNARRLAAFLAGERPTVVYFGKLIENKGVRLLLEAMRGLDARLVVAGFGSDRAALEAAADGLDVLFTGALEHRHLVHLCALADVAVVPSIFPEAFGMVAAEAAAAGCPPVVADHTGLAEVAAGLRAHYPDGLADLAAFPRGDAATLHDRLERLLALGGAERAALRGAARRAAVDLWSWPSVAERVLALAPAALPAD